MDENDDIFGLSDEEFANSRPVQVTQEEREAAAEAASAAAAKVETAAQEADDEGTPPPSGSGDAVVEPVADDAAAAADAGKAEEEEELDDAALAAKAKPEPKAKPDATKAGEAPKAEDDKPKTPPAGEVVEAKPPTPEEYKAFYDKLVGKPIKANGKEIVLKTPEEVERFVQMGAGYGRKLQEIQPHLKTLRMLEKNDLLDEKKLSFLIDIQMKNPDAIKKLIKDSGIDPLDLNMEDNASYLPTNHSVSDTEVAFADALKEVSVLPKGRDTIQHINETWDTESKQFLWDNAAVLNTIHEQRENGIYDQITTEIEKQKLLGTISNKTPFLEAYKIAGDALAAANSLNLRAAATTPKTTEAAPAPVADQQPGRVLGTRTAAPKSAAANNDKAKAAGSPVNSSRRAQEVKNPLDMADDDFLKQFDGRL